MADSAKSPFANLYNSPNISDVVIKQVASDGNVREYYGHKAILIASGFSHKAFIGRFKEASANIIELREDDPDYFEFLLKYMYTSHYDKDALETLAAKDHNNKATALMGIYVVADKYDLAALCNRSLEDLKDILNGRKHAENIHSLLAAAIRVHYGSEASPGLKDLLATAIVDHQQDFTDTAEFDVLVERYPQLAVDLTKGMKLSGRLNVRRIVCPESECRFVQTVAAKKLQGHAFAYCQKCGSDYYLVGSLLLE